MYTYDATVLRAIQDDRIERLTRSMAGRRGTRNVLPNRSRRR